MSINKFKSMRKILKNEYGNFRAGWRILFWLGISAVSFVPFAAILKLLDIFFPDLFRSGDSNKMNSFINIVFYTGLNFALVVGSWLTLRWIDRRPYTLLGLDFNRDAITSFAKGFFLGFINLFLVFLVLSLSGFIETRFLGIDINILISMFKYFIVFMVAAAFEETFNRGYVLQALIEGTNLWLAITIISIVFALGHANNTGFAWNNAIFFFVQGTIYSILYVKTCSLWVPIGFHFAWNWTQGPLFGINVSGTIMENTLFSSLPEGNVLLSGGEFGAEGSLIAIIISIIFLLWLIKTNWLKPRYESYMLWKKFGINSDLLNQINNLTLRQK
jgi:membrane protease YdiL (CAAX protease family)